MLEQFLKGSEGNEGQVTSRFTESAVENGAGCKKFGERVEKWNIPCISVGRSRKTGMNFRNSLSKCAGTNRLKRLCYRRALMPNSCATPTKLDVS
jgi:hypothetical protein